MKKRVLSLLFIFSLFFTFLIGVKALDKASSPSSIPSEGTKMYSTVDDMFDYSAISFKNESDTLAGKTNMRKIKLGKYSFETGDTNVGLTNWFSAYCLDPNLQYPMNGLARQITTSENITETRFNSAVKTALYNSISNSDVFNLFKKLNEYEFDAEISYEVPDEFKEDDTIKYKEIIDSVLSGTPVTIKFISYTKGDLTNTVTLTASEINQALGLTGDTYDVTLSVESIFYDVYNTVNLGTSTNYNRVLWIIEHSYPTLSLDRLYKDAGVDKTSLLSELTTLSGNETLSNDEKEDGYVYSTIQYAIWKVLGVKVENKTIGNELVGSNELNKIYQYLIKNRNEYSSYGSKTFTSNISIKRPSAKSEILEETTTSIKYGPYYVTSGMITSGDINLSLNNVSGVKIVDKDNNQITKVKENEKFYVLVEKSTKATSIVVTASTNEGYTFEPSTNRGRVYYALTPTSQNVVSGGIIKSTTATTQMDILVNPKTGIPNIPLLFVATLSIFSIGYVLIVHKDKQIKLS